MAKNEKEVPLEWFSDPDGLTHNEFLVTLKRYKYKLGEDDLIYVWYTFNKLGLTKTQVEVILNGAYKLYAISKGDNKDTFFGFDLVEIAKKCLSATNRKAFKLISEISNNLKIFAEDKKEGLASTIALIKLFVESYQKLVNKGDKAVLDLSTEQLEQIKVLSCMYKSLATYVKADSVVENDVTKILKDKFLKLKDAIDYLTEERIIEIDKILKVMSEEQGFSSEEINSVFSSCASLLKCITKDKYLAIEKSLSKYIDYLKTQILAEEDSITLEGISSKSIITQAPSILSSSGDQIEFMTQILSGKRLNDIENYTPKTSARNLFKYFPNIKVEGMNASNQIKILKEAPSIYRVFSPSNIFDFLQMITNEVYQAYGFEETKDLTEKIVKLRSVSFDVNSIFTASNIVDIALTVGTREEKANNLRENVSFLKKFIKIEDIHKLIQNNYNIINEKPEILQQKIKEIVEENASKGADKVLETINKFLLMPIGRKNYYNNLTSKASSKKVTLRTTPRQAPTRNRAMKPGASVDLNLSALLSSVGIEEDRIKRVKPVKKVEALDPDEELEDFVDVINYVGEHVIDPENYPITSNDVEGYEKGSIARLVYDIIKGHTSLRETKDIAKKFLTNLKEYEGGQYYSITSVKGMLASLIDILNDNLKSTTQQLDKRVKKERSQPRPKGKKGRAYNEALEIRDFLAKHHNNSLIQSAINSQALETLISEFEQGKTDINGNRSIIGKLSSAREVDLERVKLLTELFKVLDSHKTKVKKTEEVKIDTGARLEKIQARLKEIDAEVANLDNEIMLKSQTVAGKYKNHVDKAKDNPYGKRLLKRIESFETKKANLLKEKRALEEELTLIDSDSNWGL